MYLLGRSAWKVLYLVKGLNTGKQKNFEKIKKELFRGPAIIDHFVNKK